MESLNTIGVWIKKQHVLTYCAGTGESLWCANAFYIYDEDEVAFYLLSEPTTRHGQLIGRRAITAGTINSQPKTVALIRGLQFRGEISLLNEEESFSPREVYNKRFPVARVLPAPMWIIRLNELKMTDNTLGFGKKLHWQRT
ncbi:YhbP family protein [Citrobacter sp. JGM124]|uniref:YhbP family protein n=1 Tax=Citrobacter sp. JGM124 TaxID=2799789 RepID=UPI001BA6C005|nr:YhbP family protein [Citrobacter sp. JGM124]MBS0849642.1 YhbP family protein [Citrobacter sp. JGM124]